MDTSDGQGQKDYEYLATMAEAERKSGELAKRLRATAPVAQETTPKLEESCLNESITHPPPSTSY